MSDLIYSIHLFLKEEKNLQHCLNFTDLFLNYQRDKYLNFSKDQVERDESC